jgi:hypothetical protein
MVGLFGGLVGGPIASLVDYDSLPYDRFKLFIIPEFIGFVCLSLRYILESQEKRVTKTPDEIRKLCFANNTLKSDDTSE